MALFSFAMLPSPTSYIALQRLSSPPWVALSQSQHRHLLRPSKMLSEICCKPRASLSGSDPQSSDGEYPFQPSKENHEDDPANTSAHPTIHNDASWNSSAVSSGPDSSSPSTSPVNKVAALQFETGIQQEDLRESLDTLSRSLELLSSTLCEISSAIRILSATLGHTQLQAASSSAAAGYRSPSGLRDAREAEAREVMSPPVDPPEPWDNAAAARGIRGSGGPVDEVSRRSAEDAVPSYLVEQNERAHKLAYRLQQSFIQARIEGLGKPFQVAAEDFVQACMESHGLGIGLKELQLQLVLQDGSLTGAFAIRNQRWSDDPILNEESRIRSLWVRLVYATLTQLTPTYTEDEEGDPIDLFVKQVLQLASEQGYDLGRLKLEQTSSVALDEERVYPHYKVFFNTSCKEGIAFAGPDIASGAVKALRENEYLILLTMEKAKSNSK